MSLHTSVIAIRGEYLNDVRAVLERFDYRVLGGPRVHTDTERAWTDFGMEPEDPSHVKKLAYVSGGWTFIVDGELIMLANYDVWLHFSKLWQTRIFGWICDDASLTYALTVYDNGHQLRDVFSMNGELYTNEGAPLPEESDANWSLPNDADILAIAARLGAPFGDPDNNSPKHVYLLDESQMFID